MKFIAEFCQNHLGDRKILENQIVTAKENGAYFGKIQGLYSDELVKRNQFERQPNSMKLDTKIIRPFEDEYKRLKDLDLSIDDEKWFINKCMEYDLKPMITVFTHGGAKRAYELGFKHIKIASYDCESIPLIKKVMSFAHTLIISTGATSWEGVAKTAQLLHNFKGRELELAFLHATTIYPTSINELSMMRMLALKMFGFNIGYSDHTPPLNTSLFASKLAIFYGAKYIERHFTVLSKDETKDGPVSINGNELKELLEFSQWTPIEQSNYLRNNYSKEFYSTIVNTNIDPTAVEIRNKEYYKGRVATYINNVPIYSWEEYG